MKYAHLKQTGAVPARTLGLPSLQLNANPQQAMQSRELTAKQTDCLYWVALGYINRDIGILLGCCENTVKRHVADVMDKTGISTRLELLLMAWSRGMMA